MTTVKSRGRSRVLTAPSHERSSWGTDLAGSRGAGTVLPVAGQHVGRLVDQDLPDRLQRLGQHGAVRWRGEEGGKDRG